MSTDMLPIERFIGKIQFPSVADGCWLWTGSKLPAGYGKFSVSGDPNIYAHRWAYEQMVGPLCPGIVIDHLCRTPACVNPDHLEPVTPQVNTLRGNGLAAQYARRDACINGHPFSGYNLTDWGKGKRRVCRTCRNSAQRNYRARKQVTDESR